MHDLVRAAELLKAGELVAFPTETVYGLGADAANPSAVAKIFAAKGRPADHPLIVHLPDAGHLDAWAREIPATARQLAAAFWPGPLTLILKRQPSVPDAVTGGQDTVGLRVPGHQLALALLSNFGGGIAAPSANKFGRISPTTAAHVRDELGDSVFVLDGGPCPVGIESTILDLSGDAPAILRPGGITPEAISQVLGHPVAIATRASAPRVSGSLEAHYAPRTPLDLVPAEGLVATVRAALARRAPIAVVSSQAPALEDELLTWHRAPAQPAPFAQELYASLRRLDGLGLARIIIQQPPSDATWTAVNDRLRRAAAGAGMGDDEADQP
ncbi:MAG: threonylcarbamoyl-AMP synthase [Rhodocyclaceae bacterium]|nr:threonylcarbamoyl-AMP synthase [Rhodocyclaceae bacterium]